MTQISNLQSNVPIQHDKIGQQERLEEYYNNKKRMEEHHNKRIELTQLMLEKYWEKIALLNTYNRQRQIQQAQAEQGQFLDIEVK